MVITVGKLIRELKKFPRDAEIVWIDHDQDVTKGEYNGFLRYVRESEDSLLAEHLKALVSLSG